jgi:hypothetical protein
MKELKKPLGTIFTVSGTLFAAVFVAMASVLLPQGGMSVVGLAPILVIMIAAGILVGVLGVFLLLAQTAD